MSVYGGLILRAISGMKAKGLRKARKKKSHLSKVCIRPEFQRKSSHPPPDRVLNIFRKYLK